MSERFESDLDLETLKERRTVDCIRGIFCAMPTEIVVCHGGKSSTWEGTSEQVYTFETKKGPFTCKSKDITSEAQHAIDSSGTVKAEVDPEPDDFGYIRLIRFVQ
jgi:hypothetical protein